MKLSELIAFFDWGQAGDVWVILHTSLQGFLKSIRNVGQLFPSKTTNYIEFACLSKRQMIGSELKRKERQRDN